MSAIRGSKRGYDGDEFSQTQHQRVENPNVDALSALMARHEQLTDKHNDYDLVSKVDALRAEYQQALMQRSFIGNLFERVQVHVFGARPLSETIERIDAFYRQVINRAFANAAFHGDIEFIQAHLHEAATDQYVMAAAIEHAAFSGHANVVEILLTQELSQASRGSALAVAARQGHHEIVNHLLRKGDLDSVDIQRAFAEAVYDECMDVVNSFLISGCVSDNSLECAVLRAVPKKVEVALRLLAHKPISIDCREQAIDFAMRSDDPRIIKALLSNGSIGAPSQNKLIMSAAREGRADIVKVALELIDLDVHTKFYALQAAARLGHVDVVKILIGSSDEARDRAISAAAQLGELATIETILKCGPLSDAVTDKAVRYAIAGGYFDIMRVLVQNNAETRGRALITAVVQGNKAAIEVAFEGQVSEQARGQAIVEAIKFGFVDSHSIACVLKTRKDAEAGLDMVELLMRSGSIAPDQKQKALCLAAQLNQVGLIQQLLSHGEVSSQQRGEAVICAAAHGHHEIVEVLLKSGNVFKEHLGLALQAATQDVREMKGHLGIMKQLSAKAEILQEDTGKALFKAALFGHLDIVEYLVGQFEIQQQHLDGAANVANCFNNKDIVAFLLSRGVALEAKASHSFRNLGEHSHFTIDASTPTVVFKFDPESKKDVIDGDLACNSFAGRMREAAIFVLNQAQKLGLEPSKFSIVFDPFASSASAATAHNGDSVLVIPYVDLIHSQTELDEIYLASPERKAQLHKMLENPELYKKATTFVWYHELTHVLLNHSLYHEHSQETKRQIEKIADLLGAKLSGCVDGGIYYFEHVADEVPEDDSRYDHPHSKQRVAYLKQAQMEFEKKSLK